MDISVVDFLIITCMLDFILLYCVLLQNYELSLPYLDKCFI